jgi:glycosyltransferase involved in cell wall biosynthesis
MRIAFLLTSSLESPYGLGRCFPLARQLASLEQDVHIVTLHHDLKPEIPRHYEHEGVWIHYVGQMHVRKVSDTTLYYSTPELLQVVAAGTLGLVRQALNLHADVYHIGKPHPQNGTAGLAAARWLRRRRLFLDCDDLEATINRFGGAWQRRGVAWLEDTLPRWMDGVTVHSRFLESRLRTLGVPSDQILRLPSGADSKQFRHVSPVSASRWREHLALSGKRVAAYIGTMALVNHPIDLLLEAFAHLAPLVPDAVLLFVGGGADLATLQDLAGELGIADRCRFVGRVGRDQVAVLQSLALVTVDPVYDDLVARARWPLKIVESLAAGVPVVTGDVGDRWEMLGGGKAGLAVPPGDSQALADGLGAVLSDPALHQRLVEGCRAQAARYSLEDLAADLLAFYRRVAK